MCLTRLDRLIGITVLVTALLAGGLLWRGDRVFPEVESFNLADATVAPGHAQLLLVFNREMDRASVQAGLRIEPALAGKVSWIGRRMAYTPTDLPVLGQSYTVTLSGARDASARAMASAYVAHFRTPALRLAYVGVDGDEEGRLVVVDMAAAKRQAITPPNLRVSTFRPHPDGHHLLFMATDRATTPPGHDPTATQQLYSVDETTRAIELLADSKGFINYDFSISPDGTQLVLTRDQFNAGAYIPKGLWLRAMSDGRPDGPWKSFPRVDLVGYPAWFAPDGGTLLAIDAGTGFVLAPLADPTATVQFLGNFVESYGFSPDGSRIAFLAAYDEGPGGRREEYLALLDRGGKIAQIGRGQGVSADPHFSPDGKALYFLMSRTRQATSRRNDFHLFRYTIATERLDQLTRDAAYQENALDVSADGRHIAVERDAVKELTRDYRSNPGELFGPAPIHRPELWTCDGEGAHCAPLGARGVRPQWLN